MFRRIRVSAAWLGCAVGLLLHAHSAHANTPVPAHAAAQIAATPATSGAVRVLALPASGDTQGAGGDQARRMLEDFARALGRRLEWTTAPRPGEALKRIAGGRFDVVVSPSPGLLGEPVVAATLAATSPVATERYVVVGRTDNAARNPLEFAGMSIAMAQGSPHWEYFERLRRIVPDLKLHALANELPPEASLQLVADGMVDMAIVPVTGGRNLLTGRLRIKRLFDLTA